MVSQQQPAWLASNIYTFLLLALLMIFNRSNLRSPRQLRPYQNLLVGTMILIVSDTLAKLDSINPALFPISRVGNYLIFALDMSLGYLIWSYLKTWIDDDSLRIRIPTILLHILAVSNFLLVTYSALVGNHWFYYVETDGTYVRGPLYTGRAFMMLFYCVLAGIMVFVNRKKIYQKYFIPLMLFSPILVISGVLQILFQGIQFEYVGITLACLILFIYVQNRDVTSDYLTGVFNRRRLYQILESAIAEHEQHPFAALMIDINDFKKINDTYGHKKGDEVLIATADILRSSFRKDDIIARYGGDEFFIVTGISSDLRLDSAISNLQAKVKDYNRFHKRSRPLSLSIGALLYDPKYGTDADTFIHSVDSEMYIEKKAYHTAND